MTTLVSLRLLTSKKLLPLILVQLGGAFNDYLFKTIVLVVISFQLSYDATWASFYSNLGVLLLILPALIVSPLAGQLADRANKAHMIQKNKLFELAISCIALIALYFGLLPLMLVTLFLFGAQSAMFSPTKYAVIPQITQGKELVAANALITAVSFIAILAAIVLGGAIAPLPEVRTWAGLICVSVAVLGYLAARQLPETPAGAPQLKISLRLYEQSRLMLGLARRKSELWTFVVSLSWFWFCITLYLTQIPAIANYALQGSEGLLALLLGGYVVGIVLGSGFAFTLSKSYAELGLTPLMLALLGLVSWHLALSLGTPPGTHTTATVSAQQISVLIDLILAGFCSAAFALPTYSELQRCTRPKNRARMIAANNIINSAFVTAAALLGLLALGWWKLSIAHFFGIAAALCILFSAYLARRLSRPLLRLVAALGARIIYKIRVHYQAPLPESGAGLVICNHLSYADPVILSGLSERPFRFVMDKTIMEMPLLNWIFRSAGTIAICSPIENRKTYRDALIEVCRALERGELVCIFPEGQLTRTGHRDTFRRGIEKILERKPVPVYPIALSGLWGSYFSHAGGTPLQGIPRLGQNWIGWGRRRIDVRVGEAISPEIADIKELEQRVDALLNQDT